MYNLCATWHCSLLKLTQYHSVPLDPMVLSLLLQREHCELRDMTGKNCQCEDDEIYLVYWAADCFISARNTRQLSVVTDLQQLYIFCNRNCSLGILVIFVHVAHLWDLIQYSLLMGLHLLGCSATCKTMYCNRLLSPFFVFIIRTKLCLASL